MVNTFNAQKLVDSIEAHRSAFNMREWIKSNATMVEAEVGKVDNVTFSLEDIDAANTTCGTTLCIAGFAALHAGWNWGHPKNSFSIPFMTSPEGEVIDAWVMNWEGIGAEFLGLDFTTAVRLFHYIHDNDVALEALRHIANGTDPEDIYILTDDSGHCVCDDCAFPFSEME